MGKGPSFKKRGFFSLKKYIAIGLNHTVCACPQMQYVHVTDADVFDGISERLLHKCKTSLVVPYFLHFDNRPNKHRSIDHLVEDKDYKHSPLLQRLLAENRLFTYKSSLSSWWCDRKDIGPSVYVRYFSSVAVVNLLATCGVKDITLVGVDGGDKYSDEFKHLTPLTNGRSSFDVQFGEIILTAKKKKINIRRVVVDD
jgi:hypothetical protein